MKENKGGLLTNLNPKDRALCVDWRVPSPLFASTFCFWWKKTLSVSIVFLLLLSECSLFFFFCLSPRSVLMCVLLLFGKLSLWNVAFKLLKLRKCLFFYWTQFGFRTAIFHFGDWNLFGDEILFRRKWNSRRVLKETRLKHWVFDSVTKECRFHPRDPDVIFFFFLFFLNVGYRLLYLNFFYYLFFLQWK